MEIRAKDYILLAFSLLFMVLVSCVVEDSRAMVPPVNVLERPAKEIRKHIKDARYLVYDSEKEAVKEKDEEETKVAEIEEESVAYEEEYVEEYEEEMVYLGTYRITAYEWTGYTCANGNYPSEEYTVACNDLPLGSTVYIDGVGYRVVEDRGGGGSGWLDLYLGDVSACYEWGVQYRDVYLVD